MIVSLFQLVIFAVVYLPFLASCESVIVPDATWTDTDGNIIQAHGAGILKVNQD